MASLLNWRHSFQGDKRYLIFTHPGFTELVRFDTGDEVPGGNSAQHVNAGSWHQFEIRMSSNVVAVMMDGQQLMSFADPQPLPPGTISLHPIYEEGMTGSFYYDNMSVCGLP